MVCSFDCFQLRKDCSVFFFFSSRRRHTRYWRDWSSDVCSSDLLGSIGCQRSAPSSKSSLSSRGSSLPFPGCPPVPTGEAPTRSEERRVGKSVDLGGRRIIKKKNHTRAIPIPLTR